MADLDLARLKVTLETNIVQFRADMDKAARESLRVQKSMARSMKGVQTSIGNAFRGIILLAGSAGLGRLAKSVIDAGSEWERLNRLLSANQLKFVRQEADRVGNSFEASAQGFKKFSAAAEGSGLSAEKVRSTFRGLTIASAAMGLSADDTRGAFKAFEQVLSKGTVQAEELRGQLGERLPGAFIRSAEAMKITAEVLNDRLKAGVVKANEFLPELARRLEELYSDRAIANANSYVGVTNKMQNAWFALRVELANSGILADVSGAIVKFTDVINNPRTFETLKQLADGVSFLAANLDLIAKAAVGLFLFARLAPIFLAFKAAVLKTSIGVATLRVGLMLLKKALGIGIAIAVVEITTKLWGYVSAVNAAAEASSKITLGMSGIGQLREAVNKMGTEYDRVLAKLEELRKNGQWWNIPEIKLLERQLEATAEAYDKIAAELVAMGGDMTDFNSTLDENEDLLYANELRTEDLTDAQKALRLSLKEVVVEAKKMKEFETVADILKRIKEEQVVLRTVLIAANEQWRAGIITMSEYEAVINDLGGDTELLADTTSSSMEIILGEWERFKTATEDILADFFRSFEFSWTSIRDLIFDILAQIAAKMAVTFGANVLEGFISGLSGGVGGGIGAAIASSAVGVGLKKVGASIFGGKAPSGAVSGFPTVAAGGTAVPAVLTSTALGGAGGLGAGALGGSNALLGSGIIGGGANTIIAPTASGAAGGGALAGIQAAAAAHPYVAAAIAAVVVAGAAYKLFGGGRSAEEIFRDELNTQISGGGDFREIALSNGLESAGNFVRGAKEQLVAFQEFIHQTMPGVKTVLEDGILQVWGQAPAEIDKAAKAFGAFTDTATAEMQKFDNNVHDSFAKFREQGLSAYDAMLAANKEWTNASEQDMTDFVQAEGLTMDEFVDIFESRLIAPATSQFEGMIGAFHGGIESLSGSLNGINLGTARGTISIPSAPSGFSFPAFGKGAVVAEPTLAIVGEAGAERVSPLRTGEDPLVKAVNNLVKAMTRDRGAQYV